MDFLTIAFLLGLGFAVGLSGALMPGPLLIYTINESLKKGRWVGALVIIGHAIVEVFIFIFLMLGLRELMSSEIFIKSISIVGGIALIFASIQSIKKSKQKLKFQVTRSIHGVIVGGIIFTVFNPGFPIWWATAGTRLLLEGLQRMGFLGMLSVFIGHWFADLGWFLFVSMTTSKSSKFIFEKGWYAKVQIFLSVVLFVIGIYFLSTAL